MSTNDMTEISSEHTRTDHDRQSFSKHADTTAQDQQKSDLDAMEVDTEPARRPDISNLGLDSLQKELTSAFHLCKSSPIVTGPDPSVDLVSLYGLGPIAHSVARLDPVTGEKINRLRKSYEGKLKGLGLAGRNKSIKQEPGAPGSLRHMTLWPEEEWQNQKVFGKQIKISDIDTALQDLQSRAMQMEPGPVPNNDFWEDILGHEKPVKHPAPNEHSKKAASTPSGRPSMQSYATSPPPQSQEAERPRPSRGRKRHYDDNSFAGYGEGFVDDEEDPGFYSNGEGTGKKKRKKDHVAKVSTPMSSGGSYGVGMFDVYTVPNYNMQ
ncbi:hypothetical protein PENANT_c005G01393 [Penicillium antarcticum]|uniref:Mediator of RNA polymerase II transcription subunit 19 n=1 Tax=Penicillium antarcticum TaxID=416450 RepID=A0A1V6QEY8_9EURO|nr:hypothetical protein PENANT_c005G01393 [Penicillium antarcticum]